MGKSKILVIAVILLFALIIMCSKSTSPSDDGTLVTLTHEGFDFSAGQMDTVDSQNNDGETIVWAPDGEQHPDYPNGIWWRTYQSDENDGNNQTKDYGIVSLSEVDGAPTSWDEPPHAPLLADHVIVAKCRDGYVKFKVISVDTSGVMWPARVRYVFSESDRF